MIEPKDKETIDKQPIALDQLLSKPERSKAFYIGLEVLVGLMVVLWFVYGNDSDTRILPQPTLVLQKVISEEHSSDRWPVRTTDGASLAYVEFSEYVDGDLYLKSANSVAQKLTSSDAKITSPKWSPVGDKLAYIRQSSGDECQVMLYLPTTQSHQTLASCAYKLNSGLSWSFDGQSLYFNGIDANGASVYKQYALADKTLQSSFELASEDKEITFAQWRNRYELIYVSAHSQGEHRIMRWQPHSNAFRVMTKLPEITGMTLSPDGYYLLVSLHNGKLLQINIDNGTHIELTNDKMLLDIQYISNSTLYASYAEGDKSRVSKTKIALFEIQ